MCSRRIAQYALAKQGVGLGELVLHLLEQPASVGGGVRVGEQLRDAGHGAGGVRCLPAKFVA